MRCRLLCGAWLFVCLSGAAQAADAPAMNPSEASGSRLAMNPSEASGSWPPDTVEAIIGQPPDGQIQTDQSADLADLNRRLEALEEQNRKLTLELEGTRETDVRLNQHLNDAEKDIDWLEDEIKYRTFGAGFGVAFSPTNHVGPKFVLEANLRWVYGCYVANLGTCLGIAPTIEVWRFRFRFPGIGAFFYEDKNYPLSVTALPRWWDFMLTAGVDVRLWKGLELKFAAWWLIPNPEALFGLGKRKMEEYPPDIDFNWSGQLDEWPTVHAEYRGPGEAVKSMEGALKDAFKQPLLYLGLRWEF